MMKTSTTSHAMTASLTNDTNLTTAAATPTANIPSMSLTSMMRHGKLYKGNRNKKELQSGDVDLHDAIDSFLADNSGPSSSLSNILAQGVPLWCSAEDDSSSSLLASSSRNDDNDNDNDEEEGDLFGRQ